MEDSNVTTLGLTARLLNLVAEAYSRGLSQDDVNIALTTTHQVVGQVGPSAQASTAPQPGPAPRK